MEKRRAMESKAKAPTEKAAEEKVPASEEDEFCLGPVDGAPSAASAESDEGLRSIFCGRGRSRSWLATSPSRHWRCGHPLLFPTAAGGGSRILKDATSIWAAAGVLPGHFRLSQPKLIRGCRL